MAFFAWGIGFYGHGFYIVALGRTTGWPTTTLSAGVASFWLANVAGSLLLGRLIDRYGTRPAILYGALAMASGCFGLAAFETGFFTSPWQLFAIFAVMGTAYPGLSAMAISASLIPWFKRRLGLALGIGLTGASVGGAVMPPLMNYLTAAKGFGATMVTIGAVLLLSALPIVAFVIRSPKQAEAERECVDIDTSYSSVPSPGLSLFLADTRFWLITLAAMLSLGAQVGFLMHQIPLLQDSLGLSGAAIAAGLAAASGAIGRFVLGLLSSRFPLASLAAGCYLIQGFGLLLVLLGDTSLLLYAASAMAGCVIGCITMLPPLLLVDSFGAKGYGTAYGATGAAMFAMGSVATVVSGWLFDVTGDYQVPLCIMLALHLAASMLILWHGRRRRTQRV